MAASPRCCPYFLLIWVLLNAPYQVLSLTPYNQIHSLSSLYYATNGESWFWMSEDINGPIWNFTLLDGQYAHDPCNDSNRTWQGLTCSSSPGLCETGKCDIVEISLNSYGLSGALPDTFINLTSLTRLNIQSSRRLTGPMPDSFALLTNLRDLEISNCRLSGPLPSFLGSLYLLTRLLLLNAFTGSIPSVLGELSNLQYLDLAANCLSNSIPSSIGRLSLLEFLDLEDNFLSQALPSSIGQLSRLLILRADDTYLSQALPSSLGFMSMLQEIDISQSQLSQSLPSSIGSLTQLGALFLYDNYLSKDIPTTFGLLSSIGPLYLYGNLLSQTIPTSLGLLSSCHDLSLYSNLLSQTIPSSLGLVSRLIHLGFGDNLLSQSIPSSLCYLTNLESIFGSANFLSYSIPSCIGSLTKLQSLHLQNNLLSHSLPSSIGQLSNLLDLYLFNNHLTSEIPSSIAQLTDVAYLLLNNNFLSGSIPSSVGLLSQLSYLQLHNNLLSGAIPSEIGQMSNLLALYLYDNYLSGSIPSTFGDMSNLVLLFAYRNHLTGKIPCLLTRPLQQLFLQRNELHGSLDDFFCNISHIKLVTSSITNIDLSENRLTGSISPRIFLLPLLKTISLSTNCFTQQLSSWICDGQNLTVISMSGLHASLDCSDVFRIPFTKVSIGQTIGGTVPDCLWTMSNLNTLQLAGNGLQGTIGDVSQMESLKTLVLSHNYLTGVIPPSLQRMNLSSLDLSHNKLNGECRNFNQSMLSETDDDNSKSLILKVNRLSGRLSDAFDFYTTLDILDGNIFSCVDLPQNDRNSKWYQCGSIEYDRALLGMVIVLGCFLLVLTIYGLCRLILYLKIAIPWNSKNELTLSSPPSNLGFFDRFIEAIVLAFQSLMRYINYPFVLNDIQGSAHIQSIITCGIFLADLKSKFSQLTLVICLLSLPIYIIKGIKKNGENSFATHDHMYRWFGTISFLTGDYPAMLIMFLALTTICFLYQMRRFQKVQFAISSTSVDLTASPPKQKFRIYFWNGFLFLLNIALVGVVHGVYVWSTLQNLSPSLRLWTQILISIFMTYWNLLIDYLSSYSSARNDGSNGITKKTNPIWFLTCLNIINDIIIPCSATALTNPSCYQSLLIPPDKISSTYSYLECEDIATLPVLEWQPRCTSYGAAMMRPLQITPPFAYSYQCGSSLLLAYLPVFMISMTIQILFLLIKLLLLFSKKSKSLETSLMNESRKITYIKRIIEPIIKNLLILVTFGLCSPILGLYVLFTLCILINRWLFLIGHLVMVRWGLYHQDPVQFLQDKVIMKLADELSNMIDCFVICKWLLIPTTCCFISLLCWDIAGDSVGWYESLWCPIAGFCMVGVVWLWDQFLSRRSSDVEEGDRKYSIEIISSHHQPVLLNLQSHPL